MQSPIWLGERNGRVRLGFSKEIQGNGRASPHNPGFGAIAGTTTAVGVAAGAALGSIGHGLTDLVS